MAVIYDDYLWSAETFDRTEDFDGDGYLVPIPLIPSSYSGYSFIGDNDTLITLTFKSAGSITINLSNNTYYESTLLNEDNGVYGVIGGLVANNTGYLEIYNAGTNTLVASKSFTLPGPNGTTEDVSLSVSSAGTYDVKIRCQNSYEFSDMYGANNELTLTNWLVDSIYSEWDLQIRAGDSTSGMESNYVEGYLYDETGEGLPGIGIVLKENPSIGVSTDINGYYKLGPIRGELFNTGTMAVVGVIGYKTLEFPINGRRRVDIRLELEEDDPIVPEPEKPVLDSNKIVTVQNIVDLLTGDDKIVFANNASNRGYSSTKCPPIWIIDAIINSTNISLSVPSFTTSTKNKLVKYSDLSEDLYTMRFVDLDQMIDFRKYSTDYQWFIASAYDLVRYDNSLYPTSNLFYGENNTLVGTKDQWQNLYNSIYNAETNQVRLINEKDQLLILFNSFYEALYELAFGTAKQQDVYVSSLYTLTVQDWDDWASDYSDYDDNWIFAESITGPFFDGDSYPTSDLYYYDGTSSNTITGYIWQWQNLIDYVDYNFDGEWEYLGLAVPDEEWTDSYNFSNLMTAVRDIVNEEQSQDVNFLDDSGSGTITTKSFAIPIRCRNYSDANGTVTNITFSMSVNCQGNNWSSSLMPYQGGSAYGSDPNLSKYITVVNNVSYPSNMSSAASAGTYLQFYININGNTRGTVRVRFYYNGHYYDPDTDYTFGDNVVGDDSANFVQQKFWIPEGFERYSDRFVELAFDWTGSDDDPDLDGTINWPIVSNNA